MKRGACSVPSCGVRRAASGERRAAPVGTTHRKDWVHGDYNTVATAALVPSALRAVAQRTVPLLLLLLLLRLEVVDAVELRPIFVLAVAEVRLHHGRRRLVRSGSLWS
jgi:hypothetical protein